MERTRSTEELWRLLNQRIRAFLVRRVSDPAEAEDLVQETYLRIHERLGDLEDDERVEAWVFRIAGNLIVDRMRSQGRHTGPLASDQVGSPRVDDEESLNSVVADWLPAMIAKLPESDREPVRLFELEGFSQREIAARLGLSLSATKSRVQRGRDRLKAILLACCSFEHDRRGNVIGYAKRQGGADCQPQPCEPGDCDRPHP